MLVKSLVKNCGCTLIEIRESDENKEFELIAVVDYNMKTFGVDGVYYSTRVDLIDKILNRKVKFFTASKCFDYNRDYKDCITIYVK